MSIAKSKFLCKNITCRDFATKKSPRGAGWELSMAGGKIEILVLDGGKYSVTGYFDSRFDSGSPLLTQEQVLQRMPHLLAEMRIQVDLDRRLDPAEGKALHERFVQSLCGSAVTL